MQVACSIAFGLLAAAALIGGGMAVLRLTGKADACNSSYAVYLNDGIDTTDIDISGETTINAHGKM